MKTTAVRLHGAMDMRIADIELPEIGKDEVLMRVITDSLCASTYKAVKQGENHKRVPPDIAEKPIIIGHEMCGEIVEVGEELQNEWSVGQKVVIQPALKLESGYDPGYSYQYYGGNTVYTVVPRIAFERGCVIPYSGEGFFEGSLVEPLGCVLRGFKGFYHTDYSNYIRTDGAKKGGKLAILGGAGPMGIGAVLLGIGYANVSEIVVTDLNAERLAYAEAKCSPEYAAKNGCKLTYVNTSDIEDPAQYLIDQGVSSAIVNLGGNVVLIGSRPDGTDFTVGIQKPFDVNGAILAQVRAQDCAVVTSGVYQRSFVQDNKRYHHVLDPKTGFPAQTDLLSATVVCADAARADALSTAFLILGREQALAIAQSLQGVEVILVDEAMQVYYTPGLNGKVEVIP